MTMKCEGVIWDGRDITSCYRKWYLDIIPLMTLGIVSFAIFVFNVKNFRLKRKKLDSLNTSDSPINNVSWASYGAVEPMHSKLGIIEVAPTLSDRVKLAIEMVCVVLLFGFSLGELMGSREVTPNLVRTLFWGYITLLVGLRMTLRPGNKLWYHCVTIYPLVWMLDCVRFRSAWINNHNFGIGLAHFVLTTSLFVANWSSRTGDEPCKIRKSGKFQPSLESTATMFEIVLMAWFDPMLQKGYKKTLAYDDLWDLPVGDTTVDVLEAFDKQPKSTSLIWPLLSLVKWPMIFNAMLLSISSSLAFGPSLLIKILVSYVEDDSLYTKETAWICVIAMLTSSALFTTIQNQAVLICRRMGFHVRILLNSLIYLKLLKRKSSVSNEAVSTGSVINLMSVDSLKITDAVRKFYQVVEMVFQIIMAIVLLYFVMGWSALAGAFACVLMVPIHTGYSAWIAKWQKKLMFASDERIEKTNELLQSIKIIKLFAWEDFFADQVRDLRKKELHMLRGRLLVWVFAIGISVSTGLVITAIAFASYTLIEGKTLTASVAFTALALFGLLRIPIENAADVITQIMNAKVSLDRLNIFFNETETEKDAQLLTNVDGKIGFSNDASFQWSIDSFTLDDLNIEFPKGKMSVVTGATGSGKTSLLMALLGEMDLIKGDVSLPGGLAQGVAYVSQQPWLLNDTIRENVLFTLPYDEQKYNAVLAACGLNPDLEILSNGDLTEVGEKGVVLSGGQKQRISLARAIYSGSQTLLLDDCLSAVDNDTAVHIYTNALCGDLVANRTIILVSHNVQLASSKADFAVVLEDGKVVEQGSPSRVHEFEPHADDQEVESEPHNKKPGANKSEYVLVRDEEKASGALDKRIIHMYFKYCGNVWFWMGLVVLFAVENYFKLEQNIWVRNWSLQFDNRSVNYYLGMYLLIGLMVLIMVWIEVSYLMMATVRATTRVYNELLDSVVHAKMRFFESTPLGRIMNRFSKDIEGIDQTVPPVLEGVFHFTLTAVLTLILISVITPAFLGICVLVVALYAMTASYFLTSSRELKRIDSIARSPMYQHFNQTLTGVTTIRAYTRQQEFINTNIETLDHSQRSMWYWWVCTRWFNYRVHLIGALVSAGTATFVVVYAARIDSGLAGLALSYALQFSELVHMAISMYADFEMSLNGVERAKEYMSVPQEQHEGVFPPMNWPAQGKVKMENVSVRYAPELPTVLKNLNIEIEPGTKVGIVGRTGSGKSTLLSALLREVELDQGRIVIDGLDIHQVQLQSLRRNALAIIPQDPTLFKGTIRHNLDPLGSYKDADLLQALRRVQLESFDLDYEVTDQGGNMSQGQRQLVCLGRALLKRARILLMDEATASIDYETDAKIQKTIREELNDVTLLTVAHRTNTVADYDKIMVLDKGEIVAFDTPDKCL